MRRQHIKRDLQGGSAPREWIRIIAAAFLKWN